MKFWVPECLRSIVRMLKISQIKVFELLLSLERLSASCFLSICRNVNGLTHFDGRRLSLNNSGGSRQQSVIGMLFGRGKSAVGNAGADCVCLLHRHDNADGLCRNSDIRFLDHLLRRRIGCRSKEFSNLSRDARPTLSR